MKRGMTIKSLKCRADLSFEVDFGVNDIIGTKVTNLEKKKKQQRTNLEKEKITES